MKPYGPYVAARTLFESAVCTMRGMDRLTGMPVLIYSLPRPCEPPHLLHRRLVPYSDQGVEQGVPFVVAELPLHAVPAGDPLLAARGALEALIELHAQGQLHGGLTPAQLWAVDSDVRLAGAGLPWGALGVGFDAPEGGKSPQADLYALGCSLEALGGVPDALRPLLSPDPRQRPSARDALALLSRPYTAPVQTQPAPPVPASEPDPVSELLSLFDEPPAQQPVRPPEQPETVLVGELPAVLEPRPAEPPELAQAEQTQAQQTQAQQVQPEPTQPEPAQSEPVQRRPEALEGPAGAPALTFPAIRMGFEGVQVQDQVQQAAPPDPLPLRSAPAAPENPRLAPIRIGWEEDNSWRVVRSPDEEVTQATPGRPPRWAWLLGTLLALALLGGLAWWRLGSAPTATLPECCQVVFRVAGGTSKVSISVLSAPGGSGLKRGALIGVVPGTLHFPDARGAYTLRAEAEGYSPMQFQVTVPSASPVEIDLKR